MRVAGPWSLWVFLGFSPRANFIAAGARTAIRSMTVPAVLSNTDCPPMGLAEPGPVWTQVTPARRASSKYGLSGFTPSSARSWGVQGAAQSFRSSSAPPQPYRPRWQWASMKPGRMWPPAASMRPPGPASSGRADMGPVWAIREPLMSTKPQGMTPFSMVWTTPLTMSMCCSSSDRVRRVSARRCAML